MASSRDEESLMEGRRTEDEERVGLLQRPSTLQSSSSVTSSSTYTTSKVTSPTFASSKEGGLKKGQETGVCRICLEEDSIDELEAPCSCSGTAKYAHRACLQKWVDEKGNLKCEICEQQYRGEYTVPPPQPAHAGIPIDELPLFAPLYFVDPVDGTHRPIPARTLGLYDDEQFMMYNRYGAQRPNPGVSWCALLACFVLFLVVLHHAMVASDVYGNGAGGGAYETDISYGSAYGDDTYGSSGERDDYGLFLLFWIATKAFLIGVPLLMVMKVANRQARREQLAMLRAAAYDQGTARPRVVFRVRAPAAAGSPPGATQQQQQAGGAAPSAAAVPLPAGGPALPTVGPNVV